MNLNQVLNSDISTLLAEIRRAYDWWIAEIVALVPQSVRTWSTRSSDWQFWDPTEGLVSANKAQPPFAGRADDIVIPRSFVLARDIVSPVMSRPDVEQMLRLNSERYFPLPSDSVLLATATPRDLSADGTMRVDLAAITLADARALATTLQKANIQAKSVRMADEDGKPDNRFDFLPALRGVGLAQAADTTRQKWWMLVGVLAALNIATLIWRDIADVERLTAMTASQRPAIAVAKRIVAQMRAIDTVAKQGSMQRGVRDPLKILADVTQAVPEGAWVQRYAWDGKILALTGYRSNDADVAAALRRMAGVSNVKSSQTEAMAETASGRPYDLIAEIGRR